MIGKLVHQGDNIVLVLESDLVEQWGIEPDTALNVTVEGDALVVTPVRDEAYEEAFRVSVEKMHKRYSDVFRRLAEGVE
jgi:antitoxin component of MazEF toxin-antitoxin module